MTLLMVWAVVAGHFAFSQHEFADRRACERTAYMVVKQLEAEKAEKISAYCLEEPAT